MNVETGEIKEFDSEDALQEAVATGKWFRISQRPDRKCRICRGRGYFGYDIVTKKYLICKCVKARREMTDDNSSDRIE